MYPFILDYRGKTKQLLSPKYVFPCLRAENHGNHPLVVGEYESTYQDTYKREELNGMKVNSFFCGCGGFDSGFIQAGFEVVGAWDFDKYAVQSYRHNIGDHVKQADVREMTGNDIPKADGWLFGFPCQDISVAGKQAGMIKGQTRSGLFYEIMRLLEEVDEKPKWVMAENVKAVKKFIPEIEQEYSKAGYHFEYVLYNSKYWGVPQNRERYFLLGIRYDIFNELADKGFYFSFPEQQTSYVPKLSSILESNVDEKYYISDEKAAKIIGQAVNKLDDIKIAGNLNHYGNDQMNRVYDPNEVAPTALVVSGGGREIKVLENIQSVFTDKDDCSYCCDANYAKGISPGDVGNGRRTQVIEELAQSAGLGYEDGVNRTLRVGGKGSLSAKHNYEHILTHQYRVRKLTPREYFRLQGFSDSYEFVVSNSQLYKQAGNAVTVNVAYAIAKAIKECFE